MLGGGAGRSPATSSACPTCAPSSRRRCASTRRPGASAGARSSGGRWAASTYRSGPCLGLSQFAVHRDARFWPAPSAFDPERWLAPSAEPVPRGAFFPFGDGPRRCIGEHFARAEAGIVMATLARTWSLDRVSHEPVELEAKVTLRPRGGLRMRVSAR